MSRTATLVLLLTVLTTAEAQQKKRVAVMNFDYATVQNNISAIFGSNQDVGKGIADILVDRLVSDGVFSVIERKELDKILSEQNFSNSDRADASTAAKIGRVLGVDAIIIGSVTQFGRDDKKTSVGGGAVSDRLGRFGIGGVQRSQATAVVQVTARMINTSTAEILASAQGHGEETRNGTGILGAGGGGSAGGGAYDMRSSNFANTILGAAVNKAVTELSHGLEQRASALPTVVVEISGLVADAAPDGTITINVGSKAGVKMGDQLLIKRTTRVVRDPSTGKVIRNVEDQIGMITISEVGDAYAVGKFSGPGQPKTGDTVSSAK